MRGYTRRRWTCTSSGRSRRPPSVPPWIPCSGPRPRAGSAARATSALDGHASQGGHAARARRDLLLPVLHAVQDRIGWISQPALNYISKRLAVPPAEAYGVATFYALYATKPRPPVVAHVCDDIACRLAGAEQVCADLTRTVGEAGAPAGDGRTTWLRSPCLGLCDLAPAAMITTAGEAGRHRHGRAGRCRRDRRRGWSAERRHRPAVACAAPAGRRSARASCAASGSSTRRRRATTGSTEATAACSAPSRSDRRRSSPRSPRPGSSGAAARPSRPAGSGRRSRPSRRVSATSSATPTSPSRARSRTASCSKATRSRSSRR